MTKTQCSQINLKCIYIYTHTHTHTHTYFKVHLGFSITSYRKTQMNFLAKQNIQFLTYCLHPVLETLISTSLQFLDFCIRSTCSGDFLQHPCQGQGSWFGVLLIGDTHLWLYWDPRLFWLFWWWKAILPWKMQYKRTIFAEHNLTQCQTLIGADNVLLMWVKKLFQPIN